MRILIREYRRSAAMHKKRVGVLIFCAAIPFSAVLVNIVDIDMVDIHQIITFIVMVCVLVVHLRYFKYYLAESEEAIHSKKMVREMIANISHDLKTPLTVLSVNIERLLHISPGNLDYARNVRIAYNKNLDLQRLIGNLIEITRIDSQQDLYRKEWISLNHVLADTQRKYGDHVESLDLSLDVTGTGADTLIYADPEKIWAVFDNIIYNAIRHTSTGGISVVAELVDGDIITIRVIDTGCGIAPEHLKHVFDRFYKVEMGRGGLGGNSGVGLFIVKSIMENFGGSVEIESEVGVGTTVMLFFQAKGKASRGSS